MKRLTTILVLIYLVTAGVSMAQYPPVNVTVNTGALNGYFYFVPYNLSAYPTYPPGTQHQMIIDASGHVVYYRPVTGFFAGDFKQQINGKMSYCAGNQFIIMDSTFTIIDSVTTMGGIDFDIHDLQILPNGHYLLLGNEDVTMDLSSYNMFNQVGDPGSANATVTAGVLQELDSNHNVVWEWHSINNFNFDDVDEFFLNDSTHVDWTHMNSIEMDTDSNIIISSRHFDEITKINRQDSTVMWRLGGKANQFTFVNDSDMFLAQHDARRLPNGHLLLYDNGRGPNPVHKASAKEYELDEDSLIATLVWSYSEADTVYSRSQGNCQRLSNGSTLISWGDPRNEYMVFSVVDSLGNKQYEVQFPDSQITYRTFYYDSVNFLSMRPAILCNADSSVSALVADSGYASYMWSTGDTTQGIYVSSVDTFYVYVPAGDSGFVSSEYFIVTDSLDICGGVTVNEIPNERFIVYPNPVNEMLYIKTDAEINAPLQIFDITGREVIHINAGQFRNQVSVNVSGLHHGVYIVKAGRFTSTFVK
jgi:hypothetical protein